MAKRQKHVFPSIQETCHAWASGNVDWGRSGSEGRVYFEGNVIYSYGSHFPLAVRVGKNKLVYNKDQYSVSTTNHQGCLSHATNHYDQVGLTTSQMRDIALSHDEEHAFAKLKLIAAEVRKGAKAEVERNISLIKYKRSAYTLRSAIESANDPIRYANKLSKFAGSRAKPLPEVEVPDYADRLLKYEEAQTRREERARANREAYRARREAEEKEEKAKARENLKAWVKGENTTPVRGYYRGARFCWVRIKGDQVETSQYATVPLDDALKLFKLAEKCRKKGKSYMPTKEYSVGIYRLRYITKSGDIVVGCHRIKYWAGKYALHLHNQKENA